MALRGTDLVGVEETGVAVRQAATMNAAVADGQPPTADEDAVWRAVFDEDSETTTTPAGERPSTLCDVYSRQTSGVPGRAARARLLLQCLSVCLSTRVSAYLKNHTSELPHILSLHVAMARSFSGGVLIRTTMQLEFCESHPLFVDPVAVWCYHGSVVHWLTPLLCDFSCVLL